MKAGWLLWQGAFLTVAVTAAVSAAPASGDEPVPGDGKARQVIVRYAPGTPGEQRTEARELAEVGFERTSLLPRTQIVEPEPGQSVEGAIAALEADPAVLYAEADLPLELHVAPDDSHFPAQWGLLNAGQSVSGLSGTAGADIDAVQGWDIGRRSTNTVTAVIDSGITIDHPDLVNQIWTNPGEVAANGIDDDGNGFVDDVHGWDFVSGDNDPTDGSGHGTHVAGIAGATGNNGFAITGVSWDANLMPVRVCASVGGCPLSATIDGILYASMMGARVANMSLGSPSFSQAQRDAIAISDKTLFVTSAGNSANDLPAVPNQGNNDLIPQYPCMADQAPGNPPLNNVICVASTDQNDARSDFSNWGATSVDLAAPGSNILSTVPTFAGPFTDGFGGSSPRWNYARVDLGQSPTAAGWEGDTGLGRGGGGDYGVTDSYGTPYAPNSNAAMTMTGSGIDLSGREACGLFYYASVDTHRPSPNSFAGADIVYIEASGNPGGPWAVIDRLAGNSSGYRSSSALKSQASLDAFAGDPSVFLRFRLQANGDLNLGAGVFIDDVSVRCARSNPGAGNLGFRNGTSMAAPAVSGIASIVRELNPGLLPAEVKARIIGGVDLLPAFSGISPTRLVSGGRANLRNTLSSLDLTAPPVPRVSGPRGVIGNPRPTFSWSVDEPSARYELLIDGVPVAGGIGLASHTPASNFDGRTHTWQVRASDYPGNVALSELVDFRYAARGKIEVLSVQPKRSRKRGAVARVKISGPGRVVARGRWRSGRKTKLVARGSKKSGRSGKVKVRLLPTRAARRVLRGKKQLTVRFDFIFRPSSGGTPAKARRRGILASPATGKRR